MQINLQFFSSLQQELVGPIHGSRAHVGQQDYKSVTSFEVHSLEYAHYHSDTQRRLQSLAKGMCVYTFLKSS